MIWKVKIFARKKIEYEYDDEKNEIRNLKEE